jgi:hypothetical protein
MTCDGRGEDVAHSARSAGEPRMARFDAADAVTMAALSQWGELECMASATRVLALSDGDANDPRNQLAVCDSHAAEPAIATRQMPPAPRKRPWETRG